MLDLHHEAGLFIPLNRSSDGISFWFYEILLIKFLDDIVEAWDHFGWEENKLKVELLIELFDVPAVYVIDAVLHDLEFIQLTSIYLLADHFSVHFPRQLIVQHEFLNARHDFTYFNGCSVDVLALIIIHLLAHLLVGVVGRVGGLLETIMIKIRSLIARGEGRS
jgi:hypothetical protein